MITSLIQKRLECYLKHRSLTMRTALTIGVLLAILSLVLVACGSSSGSGQGNQTPTPTQPLTVQQCGTIRFLGPQLGGDRQTAMQAENCFLQASQQCHPAKLTFNVNGVDSGATHDFTIASKNGTCTISDATSHFIAPRPAQVGPTYTCASVKQISSGLLFSQCGTEGDVIVPVPTA